MNGIIYSPCPGLDCCVCVAVYETEPPRQWDNESPGCDMDKYKTGCIYEKGACCALRHGRQSRAVVDPVDSPSSLGNSVVVGHLRDLVGAAPCPLLSTRGLTKILKLMGAGGAV